MPTVSVVMVFHRLNPFMAEAVGSVLNQTFRDLELVLVDNGTGLGAEVLGEVGRDPRVRFVRLPRNEGIPGGHNAGIAAAQGEFVTLLDYDDVALPTRIEKQVAALRADLRLGLVSCCAERIDEHNTVIGGEFSLMEEAAQREYTRYAAPVVTPAYTGRREVFATLPYREGFPLAADFDFLARAAERWTMRAVPEVLLRYRWHAAQTTQQKAAEIERSLCAIRLLTARRRASRAENLVALDGWLKSEPTSRATSCRYCAELCLVEKFPVLAAYHARRMFTLERTVANFARASGLVARALKQTSGPERRLAARMFLTGPVRALGLRSA
jgi:glycosyltransferase involved in cell wall biosynthesis